MPPMIPAMNVPWPFVSRCWKDGACDSSDRSGPFTIDTAFPSFHAIADDFGLSKWAVQQTLTVYLLPLSIMSLVQGPASDALGRRPVILAGLCVYTLASVGCTFAPNFTTLSSRSGT